RNAVCSPGGIEDFLYTHTGSSRPDAGAQADVTHISAGSPGGFRRSKRGRWWRSKAVRRARRALFVAGGAAALGAAALGIGAATARPAAADTQTYEYGPGYWMASSDGGIFAFGHGGFDGSPANATRKSLVSVDGTASGKGYWV